MSANIIGWAHAPFGKLESETIESLIAKTAARALAHSGVAPGDIDEIFLGHFNACATG